MVNSIAVWNGKTLNTTGNNVTYLSAKDFGKYVPDTTKTSTTSQIVVKLFETTNLKDDTSCVNLATAQYWQAVYRSTNSSNDVLTLYMCVPYRFAAFSESYNAYYRSSYVRNDCVLKLYDVLAGGEEANGIRSGGIFGDLDSYVVAPSAIPGLWQSSIAQTGTGTDVGDSGYTAGVSKIGPTGTVAINNGLDGWTNSTIYNGQSQTVLPTNWAESSYSSPYNDKLWIPSSYEVIFKDSTVDGEVSYLTNENVASATINNGTSGSSSDGRSGLWELNGYDRAGYFTWVRSAYLPSEWGTDAMVIDYDGTVYVAEAYDGAGRVRPALHLDLGKLADDKLAKVSATADSSNDTTVTLGFLNGVTGIPSSSSNYRYLAKTTSNVSTVSSNYNSTTITLTYDALKGINKLLVNNSSISFAAGTYTIDGVCKYAISNTTQSGSQKTTQITISEPQTNVAIKYAVGEPVCQVTFKTTFSAGSASAQDWGIMVYVLRENGTGGYAESYSIFVKKEETEQTFDLSLQDDCEYILLVSKPYLWQLTLNGQANKTCIKFTTTSASETVTIAVSGGGELNSYICV